MNDTPLLKKLKEDLGLSEDDNVDLWELLPTHIVSQEMLAWNDNVETHLRAVGDINVESIPDKAWELCKAAPHSLLRMLHGLDYLGRPPSYLLLQHYVNGLIATGTTTVDELVRKSKLETEHFSRKCE